MPIDTQMPSTCHHKGKVNTASVGNTNVLTVDNSKEIAPLDNAVKKDDTKMFTPTNRKQREYTQGSIR